MEDSRDGGSQFKTAIVKQIIEESLKRNYDNELWYRIQIHQTDEEANGTITEDFRWSEEDECWIIRHINRICRGWGDDKKWTFEPQYLILDDLNRYFKAQLIDIRIQIDEDEDEFDPLTVKLSTHTIYLPTTPSSDINFKSEIIEIKQEDYLAWEGVMPRLMILCEYAKSGFRSARSFKKAKK